MSLDAQPAQHCLERMRRGLRGSVLLVALAACGDGGLDPLPLDITVEVSRTTATPGQAIAFVVNAQGGSLVGIAIDYRDGNTDQRATSGARTARVTFQHSYAAAGVYQVRATVTDGVAGTKDAAVEIRVQ